MRQHRKMSKRYRRMPINRDLDRPRRIFRVFLVLLLFAVVMSGGYFLYSHLGQSLNFIPEVQRNSLPQSKNESPSASVSSQNELFSQSEKNPVSITILGAGDNLIHEGLYNQAKRRAGGKGYDFSFVYGRITKQVQTADIAVVNQETPLAGKVFPLSGYPKFNSPVEVGDALLNTGFDVICQGNNHVFDMGEKGVAATLDYWKTKSAVVTGVYRNEDDLQNIRIIDVKGVRTAYLAVTEQTNGLSLPKNSAYRVLMTSDTEKIRQLIQKAKKMADVVVVSAHWGNENTYEVTQKQKQLAQQMVDWGADIIFGNHPHAIQELTVLKRSDGTQCPVIYALGNLVSAQSKGMNMVSGLLTVTVTKDFNTGKTNFTKMDFEPIVTHFGRNYSQITIYPLEDYSDKLAAQHGVRAETPDFSLSFIQKIIDRNIPKKYIKNH